MGDESIETADLAEWEGQRKPWCSCIVYQDSVFPSSPCKLYSVVLPYVHSQRPDSHLATLHPSDSPRLTGTPNPRITSCSVTRLYPAGRTVSGSNSLVSSFTTSLSPESGSYRSVLGSFGFPAESLIRVFTLAAGGRNLMALWSK